MYIRTKDGMYEVIREILDGEAYEVKVPQSKWEYDEDNKCYYEDSKIDGFCKKDIINQSENLEELCDMFVCGGAGFEMPSEMPLSHTTQYQKMKILIKFGMIGGLDVWLKLGIWTDKGLIYVAKMDSEGKLVLI